MGTSPSRPSSSLSSRLAGLSDLSGSIRRRQDSGHSSATGVEMDGKPNDLNEPLLRMGADPAPPSALVVNDGEYVGAGGGAQRRRPSELEAWQFPGWGQTQRLTVSSPKPVGRPTRTPGSPMPAASPKPSPHQSRGSDSGDPSSSPPYDPSEPPQGDEAPVDWEHGTAVHAHVQSDEDPEAHKLGQFSATAIAGNDILSSVLYTAGLCGSAAGVYAPISMALIVCMLYLFRKVYGEVGSALPLNGGAYNALLNTTSKATASVAACLTILSYVATGVVAAADANYYLQQVWEGLNIYVGTIVLLAAFAFLNFMGLTESAFVALLIFTFHTLVLVMLLILGVVQLAKDGFGLLTANYHSPLQPSLGIALVYGFSAASLGITGFETSSNYIEEQKEGVFPKTLRNMWWVVLIFNPTLVFLAFCLVPIDQIMDPSVQPVVLSTMARIAAGRWFEILVSVDAFLVLSGSVLTAYVGVTGLFKRLAGDRCLPEFLLQTNKWRGTNHWIILLFLGICCSLYGVVAGKVDDLAGVYSIAFLCVMSLFAVANMLLKYKRNELPRNIRASWPGVSVALLCVLTALGITVARNTDYDKWFAIYFIATALLFAISFNRVQLLKIIMYSMRYLLRKTRFGPSVDAYITKAIKDINQNPVVFFSKTAKLSVLNKAILYIRDNELTNWVRIVHVATSEDKVPSNFVENVRLIDSIYPKLRIDAVLLQGEFGPDAIETVSQEYHIPKNMVFITCPTTNFRHKIGSLGGVRVITHSSTD